MSSGSGESGLLERLALASLYCGACYGGEQRRRGPQVPGIGVDIAISVVIGVVIVIIVVFKPREFGRKLA